MKKKIIIVATVFVVALVAAYGVYNNQNKNALADLVLDNIDAFAEDDEYVIGPIFTNWKVYRIKCTRTEGFLGIVTDTYDYWTDACGKGDGSCMYNTGC